jgi:transposase-like protein
MISTEIRAQILEALSNGRSIAAAARDAGVHRSTIHLWIRTDAELSLAVDRARATQQSALFDELQDLAAQAVETLRELLTQSTTPASVKLRAAQAILKAAGSDQPSPELRLSLGIEQTLSRPTKFDTSVESVPRPVLLGGSRR